MKIRKFGGIMTALIFMSVVCINADSEKSGMTDTPPFLKNMKGAELDKIMQNKTESRNYLVVDVREDFEYNEKHVKYAVQIRLSEIENRMPEIADWKNKNLVLICRSGSRSGRAAAILQKNGFNKLFNADGMSTYPYKNTTVIRNIRANELKKNLSAYSVIDGRNEKDFKTKHLDGAVNFPIKDISAKTSEIQKEKTAAVYSYYGDESFEAAEKLSEKNIKAVNCIDGTEQFLFL